MKRIWIGVILIAISISLCTYEQVFIRSFCRDLDRYIAQENTTRIVELWEEKNDIMYVFSNHGILDEMAKEIHILEEKEYDKKSTLTEIKALNNIYYENQIINLSNIF